MNLNLDDYGIQIKNTTFRLKNDEDNNGKPFLLLVCLKCNTFSNLNFKVNRNKKEDSTDFYFTNDNQVNSIKELIAVSNQTNIYCPICGAKHDIVNVEVSCVRNDVIYDRGINIKDDDF